MEAADVARKEHYDESARRRETRAALAAQRRMMDGEQGGKAVYKGKVYTKALYKEFFKHRRRTERFVAEREVEGEKERAELRRIAEERQIKNVDKEVGGAYFVNKEAEEKRKFLQAVLGGAAPSQIRDADGVDGGGRKARGWGRGTTVKSFADEQRERNHAKADAVMQNAITMGKIANLPVCPLLPVAYTEAKCTELGLDQDIADAVAVVGGVPMPSTAAGQARHNDVSIGNALAQLQGIGEAVQGMGGTRIEPGQAGADEAVVLQKMVEHVAGHLEEHLESPEGHDAPLAKMARLSAKIGAGDAAMLSGAAATKARLQQSRGAVVASSPSGSTTVRSNPSSATHFSSRSGENLAFFAINDLEGEDAGASPEGREAEPGAPTDKYAGFRGSLININDIPAVQAMNSKKQSQEKVKKEMEARREARRKSKEESAFGANALAPVAVKQSKLGKDGLPAGKNPLKLHGEAVRAKDIDLGGFDLGSVADQMDIIERRAAKGGAESTISEEEAEERRKLAERERQRKEYEEMEFAGEDPAAGGEEDYDPGVVFNRATKYRSRERLNDWCDQMEITADLVLMNALDVKDPGSKAALLDARVKLLKALWEFRDLSNIEDEYEIEEFMGEVGSLNVINDRLKTLDMRVSDMMRGADMEESDDTDGDEGEVLQQLKDARKSLAFKLNADARSY